MPPIPAEAAWARIDAHATPFAPENVPRHRSLGRVLAAPLDATVDLPQADVSAMDGYILAGGVGTDASVPVIGTAAAGVPADLTLQPGQAAKIMTGAVVPPGGDRVVPVEQTDAGDQRVVVHTPPAEGAHIRRHGEVVRAGEPLMVAGTVLGSGAISLLAAHGHDQIPVVRQPTVATLATGNEVVPPEQDPGPGQLRDSNSAYLGAALADLGIEARALGIAPDDASTLATLIEDGLRSDVLLLCGGVSMGEFDLVEGVLARLDCEVLFEKVAVQPGKPLVAARHAGGWVFGLPGNPASVMVTFLLFARPLLRRLMGHDDGFWHGSETATLCTSLPKGAPGRDRFLAASTRIDDGQLTATPHPPRGSHDLGAYALGDALVRIRAQAPERGPGDLCEVLRA